MADLVREWAHILLDLPPLSLAIAILLAVVIPIFLHSVVFHASGLTTLPSILLIGPSGSGKTSLLTLFERGTSATTHTSQTPLSVEISLPVNRLASSDKYRSSNDPSTKAHKKFLLIDTPGHGKLRHHALSSITEPLNLKGLIFVVDAATLSAGDETLRQTADYLHDTLLSLQKRNSTSKSSKSVKELPVLIAANKMDLFTAIPAKAIKNLLESEITKVRVSRSRGLLDSGIGMDSGVEEEKEDDWLGEVGSKVFRFEQMEEFEVQVEVVGGNVVGEEGARVEEWWSWIADRL